MLLQDWKRNRKNRKKRKRKMMEKKKRKRILKRKKNQQKRRRWKLLLLQGILENKFYVRCWLLVGKAIRSWQDKNSFPLGYLPKAGKHDDNTIGKKKAHEMRGKLLTILCYCLLQFHYKEVSDKIGGEVLAKFDHIYFLNFLQNWN